MNSVESLVHAHFLPATLSTEEEVPPGACPMRSFDSSGFLAGSQIRSDDFQDVPVGKAEELVLCKNRY